MATSNTYIIIKKGNDIIKKVLGSTLPTGNLRSLGGATYVSQYCYSFALDGSTWYFGFSSVPGFLVGHSNQGSIKLPVSIGELTRGSTVIIGIFNSFNQLPGAPSLTMQVPLNGTIYDSNAVAHTISFQTETIYLHSYYVLFNDKSLSYILRTPSSGVNGLGTSSRPWTWTSSTNSETIEFDILTSSLSSEIYLNSATESGNRTVSYSDVKVSGIAYKRITITGISESNSAQHITLTINDRIKQDISMLVYYCAGVLPMVPNQGTDKGDFTDTNGCVARKYTLTSANVPGSKKYNITFNATDVANPNSNNWNKQIYYISEMTGGGVFSIDANNNPKLTYAFTLTETTKDITVKFGKYSYIGIRNFSGIISAFLKNWNNSTCANAFKSAEFASNNATARVYRNATCDIEVKSDTDKGYYFNSTHGIKKVSGSNTTNLFPITSCPTYTINGHTVNDGGYIDITTEHYSITASFVDSNFANFGSIQISYDNKTWSNTLNFNPSKMVYVKYTPKANQSTINPYAFMFAYARINGTNVNAPANYTNFNNSCSITFTSTSVIAKNSVVAYLTQRRWKVTLIDSERSKGWGTTEISAASGTAFLNDRKFSNDPDSVYVTNGSSEQVVITPKANTHYRFKNATLGTGLLTYGSDSQGNRSYYLQDLGDQTRDTTITVNYERNDHYIVTTSTNPDVQTVRVRSNTINGSPSTSNYGYYSKDEYLNKSIVVDAVFSGENVGKYKVSTFSLFEYDYNEPDHKGNPLYIFSESANEIEKDLTSDAAHTYFIAFLPSSYGVDDILVEVNVVSLLNNLTVEVKSGSFTTVDGIEVFTPSQQAFGYTQTRIGNESYTQSNDFNRQVKDGTVINVDCGSYYGGILNRIVVEDINGSQIYNSPNNPFQYSMALGDAKITVYFCEREKFNLIANAYLNNDETGFNVGSIEVVASNPTTEFRIEAGTSETEIPLYVGEEYVCTVKPLTSEYFTRRYFFGRWDVDRGGSFDSTDDTPTENIETNIYTIFEEELPVNPIRLGARFFKRDTAPVIVSYALRTTDGEGVEVIEPIDDEQVEAILPGCKFTYGNDAYFDEATNTFFTGNDVKINCTIEGAMGQYIEDGIASGVVIYKPLYINRSVGNPDNYSVLASRDNAMKFSSEFTMMTTTYIQVVFQIVIDRGLVYIRAGYCGQSDNRNGALSIFATDMGTTYIESRDKCEAAVKAGKKVVLMAAVKPHYFFAGWYSDSNANTFVGSDAVLEIPGDNVNVSTPKYYARFLPSSKSAVLQWNGDEGNSKDSLWRSRVYSASSYFSMTSIAVYADNYPVAVKFYYSSSPIGIFDDNSNTVSIMIHNQNATRLPKMRPEKYFAFQVEGKARINHVAIGSSMEAIR